jgi:hypothetical protein
MTNVLPMKPAPPEMRIVLLTFEDMKFKIAYTMIQKYGMTAPLPIEYAVLTRV